MGWFGFKSRDERATEALIAEVARLRAGSRIAALADAQDFIVDLLVEVCADTDLTPSALLVKPLANISLDLFLAEPFCINVDKFPSMPESLAEGAELRAFLRRAVRILKREDHYLDLWRAKLKAIWRGVIVEMPVNVLVDPRPDGTVERQPVLAPTAPLHSFVDSYSQVLDRMVRSFFDSAIEEAGLFHDEALKFEAHICAASGIAWLERHTSTRPYVMPSQQTKADAARLTELYTQYTSFADLFTLPVPLPIPQEVRFEHTHIIGGTGHGKTQLLQLLIADDLHRALNENLSVIVLDPDGTLIDTLTRLRLFEPHILGDRAIFIDPTDSQQPVGLNLFDVATVAGADRRARETVENNTIELFEYFFDALLGSELTNRQSTLFRYLGLLLMQIPGGNIHTLRELMEDGEPFRPYMEQLTGTARTFFETRFFDRSLNQTKQQILARLWGVLSNRSLDRLFSAKRNTVQFDQAMQDGKLIFVNSSKEYLGEEGSHIFARMMVALLGQGLIRRAALPPQARTPTYIYIDEAEGVVDHTLIRLLAQVRKYHGAITLAHQHLDQLSAGARGGVFANTSIKLAGGVSAQDAVKLAPEFRVDKDFILGQQKGSSHSHFALFAKNVTPRAMALPVPLGFVEKLPRLSGAAHAALIARSRERYGWRSEVAEPSLPPDDASQSAPPPSSLGDPLPAGPVCPVALPAPDHSTIEPTAAELKPASVVKEGGGGVRHREIQQLVKELGEAAGYRASLEEFILDGEGRVDVILRRDKEVICCEVSVTTTKEHELLNVQKCFAYGADSVWLVANTQRHQTGLTKHIRPLLSDSENEQLQIIEVEALSDLLPALVDQTEKAERIVRGYRVRSTAPSKRLLRERISEAFLDPTSD